MNGTFIWPGRFRLGGAKAANLLIPGVTSDSLVRCGRFCSKVYDAL